jgi:hypothetical protein
MLFLFCCISGREVARCLLHIPRAGRQELGHVALVEQPGVVSNQPGQVRRGAESSPGGPGQGLRIEVRIGPFLS